MVNKMVEPELGIGQGNVLGEFGEVTAIIDLVINFLAFDILLLTFRDISTYIINK